VEGGRTSILLVEDDPGDVRLVESHLARAAEEAFELTRAKQLADARALLAERHFDAVLLDLSLPDSRGLDTVQTARSAAGTTPIVVMTALDDEEVAVEALRSGAQDYLVKGKFGSRDLVRALRYAIERERIELEALLPTREALSAIIAASPAAVLSLDTECRVLTWNQSAERIFGWTAAEVVGGPPPFVPADQQEEFWALFQRELAGESVSDLELKRCRKDGTLIDVSLSTGLTRSPDGSPTGVMAVMTDITERKVFEEQLAAKNAQLAELNDVKNQMLGMAAHDLRNPLHVVNAASSLLLDKLARDVSEAEKRDLLDRIYKNSEFMLNLIDDLLDVAKIETGRLDLTLATGDLCGLIEENMAMNRVLARKKGIRLDFAPERGLPALRFDGSRLEQVLNNLISNALKFSPPGGTVTVRASRVDGSVVVSVHDHGQGIPAKELELLFKPFSKTSVHSTAGEKSTGLGLAICRKIVEGHHGRIWAESEVSKGSVFSFSLPDAARD
jgi:PAS domain S-box-containing protein